MLIYHATMLLQRLNLTTFCALVLLSSQASSAQAPRDLLSPPAPAINVSDGGWIDITQNRVPYVEVPIHGRIDGSTVTAVGYALGAAKRIGVDRVVFVVDSDGGFVQSAEKIADEMKRLDADFVYVAVVRKALSAAIWILVGCDEIYVEDAAVIGGALVYTIEPTGNLAVDEKLNSIHAARVAATAEAKKHSPELVRGMMLVNAEVVAYETPEGFRPRDRLVGPPLPTASRVIKSSGTILTLTGEESINLGFANGAVKRGGLTSLAGKERWLALEQSLSFIPTANGAYMEMLESQRLAKALAPAFPNIPIPNPPSDKNLQDWRIQRNIAERLYRIQADAHHRLSEGLKAIEESLPIAAANDPLLYPRIRRADGTYVVASVEDWRVVGETSAAKWREARLSSTRALNGLSRLQEMKPADLAEPEMAQLFFLLKRVQSLCSENENRVIETLKHGYVGE